MEIFLQWLSVISGVLTPLGVIFLAYRTFTDPDIQAKNRLDVMESSCQLKHSNIDEILRGFGEELTSIKENHLTHIERDISNIKADNQAQKVLMENLIKSQADLIKSLLEKK